MNHSQPPETKQAQRQVCRPLPLRLLTMRLLKQHQHMNLPSLKFQEVILGPKAGKLDEWQQWLSDQGNRCQIRKSAIPFG